MHPPLDRAPLRHCTTYFTTAQNTSHPTPPLSTQHAEHSSPCSAYTSCSTHLTNTHRAPFPLTHTHSAHHPAPYSITAHVPLCFINTNCTEHEHHHLNKHRTCTKSHHVFHKHSTAQSTCTCTHQAPSHTLILHTLPSTLVFNQNINTKLHRAHLHQPPPPLTTARIPPCVVNTILHRAPSLAQSTPHLHRAPLPLTHSTPPTCTAHPPTCTEHTHKASSPSTPSPAQSTFTKHPHLHRAHTSL